MCPRRNRRKIRSRAQILGVGQDTENVENVNPLPEVEVRENEGQEGNDTIPEVPEEISMPVILVIYYGYGRTGNQEIANAVAQNESSNEEEFIDKIIKKRIKEGGDGEYEYLFRRKGIRDEYTWETADNLGCPEVLIKFEQDWEEEQAQQELKRVKRENCADRADEASGAKNLKHEDPQEPEPGCSTNNHSSKAEVKLMGVDFVSVERGRFFWQLPVRVKVESEEDSSSECKTGSEAKENEKDDQ